MIAQTRGDTRGVLSTALYFNPRLLRRFTNGCRGLLCGAVFLFRTCVCDPWHSFLGYPLACCAREMAIVVMPTWLRPAEHSWTCWGQRVHRDLALFGSATATSFL